MVSRMQFKLPALQANWETMPPMALKGSFQEGLQRNLRHESLLKFRIRHNAKKTVDGSWPCWAT